MKWYTSSWERPSKSSARLFAPASVAKTYSLSIWTQGSSKRMRAISSLWRVCRFSASRSSWRAASHSSRVPVLCSNIVTPLVNQQGSHGPRSSHSDSPARRQDDHRNDALGAPRKFDELRVALGCSGEEAFAFLARRLRDQTSTSRSRPRGSCSAAPSGCGTSRGGSALLHF